MQAIKEVTYAEFQRGLLMFQIHLAKRLELLLKSAIFMAIGLSTFTAKAQVPTVSNVRVEQRSGTKLVDVFYDLDAIADVSLMVTDGGQTVTVSSVSGDLYNIPAGNSNQVIWNAGSDWDQNVSTSLGFTVSAVSPPPYMVVDLSSGPTSSNYTISYHYEIPQGGWTGVYKTTSLVLRRIPRGTFTMGTPVDEYGHNLNEKQHSVTISKDFYIGVYEITQRQWERVMGNWPSYFSNPLYRDTRPVERISYNMIRENFSANSEISPHWPQSSQAGTNSFIGKLRRGTIHPGFDLPTEAQWEYACRAGTLTSLNSGANPVDEASLEAALDQVARHRGNGGYQNDSSVDTDGGTASVGSYLPNAWSLYDMHGNVNEPCLDWYGYNYSLGSSHTNPVGASTGGYRMRRGGDYYTPWSDNLRSGDRTQWGSWSPDEYQYILGVRVVVNLQ